MLVTMNYLAHLFLAQRNPFSLVGNIMGDFIRDVDITTLPQAVARGVENHKAVDRFTDNHIVLKELKTVFSRRRRFAGIIIDVVFDHFLLKHWEKYTREGRADFIVYCYESLLAMEHIMPPRMRHRMLWMTECDLLTSYAGLDGVGAALNGISARMRFDNHLAGAVEEVVDHYEALEKGFLNFFQELCQHIGRINIETGHGSRRGDTIPVNANAITAASSGW
jgi:acyl carrier protein phosphodiesterase